MAYEETDERELESVKDVSLSNSLDLGMSIDDSGGAVSYESESESTAENVLVEDNRKSQGGIFDNFNDVSPSKTTTFTKSQEPKKDTERKEVSLREIPDVKAIVESVFGGEFEQDFLTNIRSWEEQVEASNYRDLQTALQDLKKSIQERRSYLREKQRERNENDTKDEVLDESNILPANARRKRGSKHLLGNMSEKSKLEKQIAEQNAAIDEFLKTMSAAAELDRQENINKKPSLNKINLLSKFKSGLMKPDWQNRLLQVGVLKVVHAWLEPLPDKTLPNPIIRETLLQMLKVAFWNVDISLLKASNLGKIVNFYANYETNSKIKNLAQSLVFMWMSLNYTHSEKTPQNFTRLNQEQLVLYSKQVRTGRRVKKDDSPVSNLKERTRGPLYASAPLLIPMDFVKQPESDFTYEDEDVATHRHVPISDTGNENFKTLRH